MRSEGGGGRGAPDSDPDLDAEREIDLARYGWAILSRWWLVLAAIAVGAVIGWLVALGGGDTYQARATIYPGQPLTPSSNAQIQSIQTNPSTINQIVKSESVVRSVADQVDVPANELRNGISTKAVSGAVGRSGQTQLVEVIVRGPWRRASAEAANLLAGTAVERISTYPDAKIEQLENVQASITQQIESSDAEIERYRDALEQGDLGSTEQLVVVGLLNGARRDKAALVQQQSETELSLSLARDVERGRVITRATARQVAAQSNRSSIVVGAVIGLVVGIVLALLWDPVRQRLGRGEAA